MIREITVYMIQDERSKLWYHCSPNVWVKQTDAQVFTTLADVLMAGRDIKASNQWCDKDIHKRKPKLHTFPVTVRIPS